ncbi:hypothetical protein B0H13DRAFT_1886696 [Mycena leptocephala]|nr:hypothetical protein B0H13DRAFT_1886696 [Mycena leptocephala]
MTHAHPATTRVDTKKTKEKSKKERKKGRKTSAEKKCAPATHAQQRAFDATRIRAVTRTAPSSSVDEPPTRRFTPLHGSFAGEHNSNTDTDNTPMRRPRRCSATARLFRRNASPPSLVGRPPLHASLAGAGEPPLHPTPPHWSVNVERAARNATKRNNEATRAAATWHASSRENRHRHFNPQLQHNMPFAPRAPTRDDAPDDAPAPGIDIDTRADVQRPGSRREPKRQREKGTETPSATRDARKQEDKRTTWITPIAREAVLHALVAGLLGGGGARGGGCALGVPSGTKGSGEERRGGFEFEGEREEQGEKGRDKAGLNYSEEVELIRRREGRQREKRRKAKESGGDEAREQEGRGINPSGDGRQHHQESRSQKMSSKILSKSHKKTHLPPPGLAMRQCARPAAPAEGERLLGGVALVDVPREQVGARELVAAVLAFVGPVAGGRGGWWIGMGWGAEDSKEEGGEE